MRINHQNAKEIKKNYLYINMKLKKNYQFVIRDHSD